VLDLDETLIHSHFRVADEADLDYDHKITVKTNKRRFVTFVKERPYCREFLDRASEKWELVLFTASIGAYANECCNIIDEEGLFFWRLFRDSCVGVGSTYAKDLAILGRDPSRTLILDNSPVCYLFNPEQGIPIESWYDDMGDTQLLDILPVLDEMACFDDVREGLRSALPWYPGGVEGCSGPCKPGSALTPQEGREMYDVMKSKQAKKKEARKKADLAALRLWQILLPEDEQRRLGLTPSTPEPEEEVTRKQRVITITDTADQSKDRLHDVGSPVVTVSGLVSPDTAYNSETAPSEKSAFIPTLSTLSEVPG